MRDVLYYASTFRNVRTVRSVRSVHGYVSRSRAYHSITPVHSVCRECVFSLIGLWIRDCAGPLFSHKAEFNYALILVDCAVIWPAALDYVLKSLTASNVCDAILQLL